MAACLAVVNAQSTNAAPPSATSTANVYSHLDGDGTSYFALSLRPKSVPANAATGHDHVVLVDTSASQAGEHRRQAFAVVKSFLASLPKGDRVQVFAVDLKVAPLTKTFSAPDSDEVASALKSLNRRFPAGATDMAQAVTSAANAFDGKRLSSVVYVGDGMSTGNLIQSPQAKTLVNLLKTRKVAVHSYAVGPKKDLHLLGMLAQQTGGVVLIDRADDKQDRPETVGRQLAVAAVAPILYPTAVKTNGDIKLLPAKALPMRADRATIYLGKGKLAGEVEVSVHHGNNQTLSWKADRKHINKGHVYVRPLWQRAEATAGMSVSFAGNHILSAAHDAFNDHIDQFVQLGERAVAARQFEQAERYALAIEKLDPANAKAKSILKAVAKADIQNVALLQQKKPAKKAPDSVIKKAKTTAKEDDALEKQMQRQRAILEMLQANVEDAIAVAKQVAPRDASGARSLLKEQLDTVIATTRIDPVGRQQLIKRIRTVMQEIQSKREVNELKMIRVLERQAQKESQARLVEQLQIEEDKLTTLIDQVRGLIEDGIHGHHEAYEEAEAVARVAVDTKPGDGTATAALFVAEAAGHLSKAFRLRSLRNDRFLETLYQVELSHVPFPDEPPIRWPAAEVWQALTERRKKWASVDLHKNSPAEERIQQELKKTTEVDFVDATLNEARTQLAELHNITILFDPVALAAGDITPDQEINLQLTGISLRSALKLILEQHADTPLTYIIEDEVMKIVTQEKADSIKTVRVYPVGDLVIPIPPPGALGGGIGGGGLGQGGLGQGGLGQGGLGQGGLGQGGQQGGGFYSVPPGKFRRPARTRKALNRKQKIGDAEMQQLFDQVLGANTPVAKPFRGQAFAQGQPWMYDVLVGSMKIIKRPDEEINRVLSSRIDITGSDVASMMYTAAHFVRFGAHDLALRLYRQASRIAPTRPEPYVLGLKLARQKKDYEAIQWAATGILTTTWTRNHKELHQAADDAAADAHQALMKAGRTKEAKALLQAMARAHQRDLILKLTWSGSGDLDLLVDEPLGTTCSTSDTQTAGGGVLVHDGFGPKQENCYEEYVCAYGMPGKYRVRIRHVYGDIVGKRATLKVIRGLGTPHQSVRTFSIELTRDDKVIRLSLPHGRRTKAAAVPTSDKIAIVPRTGGRKQRLPQRITPAARRAGRRFARSQRRFGGPGVGYRPVLSLLSEGAAMSAMAVVSGDRRYVRLTISPQFTQITDVFTYSFNPGGSNIPFFSTIGIFGAGGGNQFGGNQGGFGGN
eukprot:g22018.t1